VYGTQIKPTQGFIQDIDHPIAKQMEGRWLQSERGGKKVFNLVNNLHTMDLYNNTTWEDTLRGPVLEFGGNPDFALIPHDPALTSSKFTVSFWMRVDSLSFPGEDTLKKGNFSVVDFWFVINNSTGKLEFYVGSVNAIHAAQSTTTIAINTWYFVAGVHDGVHTKIYINGSYEATASVSLAPALTTLDIEVAKGFAPNRYHPGNVDDIRYFSGALTDVEIKSLYVAPYQDLIDLRAISIGAVEAAAAATTGKLCGTVAIYPTLIGSSDVYATLDGGITGEPTLTGDVTLRRCD
jgi:hypothetical protein